MADGEEVPDLVGVGDDVLDALGDAVTIGRFISKALPTHRQCCVHIHNESALYVLRNPKLHTDTGLCADPLPVNIKPDSSGQGLFRKSPYSLRGSGGVFTYDLYNSETQKYDGRMAVLYKVPYDLNLRSVQFAVGLVDLNTECDKQLFQKMFTPTEGAFAKGKAGGSSLTFEGEVTIRANMSNSGGAVLKIHVTDD